MPARPLTRTTLPRTLAVAACAAAFLSAGTASASARTYLFDGGAAKLAYKPRTYTAAGSGASARARDLRWSTWTATRAVASGTAVINDCDPDCATGRTFTFPGRITLSRPATCRAKDGRRLRYFRTLRYTVDVPKNNGLGAKPGRNTTVIPTAAEQLQGEGCHR